MLNGKIDLRSDTVTQPTDAMRAVMAAAEVGDDVFGDDPTVIRLQQYAAALLGKDAALFVPSGTMANLLAILTQTRPGDSVLLSDLAHPYIFEAANAAHFAGVMFRPIAAEQGLITPEQVAEKAVLIDDPHFSRTKLLMIENTMNLGGGVAFSLEQVAALSRTARDLDMAVHIDGARLFNATVATGVSPRAYAEQADTVSFCLSKGLGCPVGSLLVGNHETIGRALRYRKALGGGMRQAGILAAAGLYALEHNVARLAEDHRRAAEFSAAIGQIPSVKIVRPGLTNLVYFEVPNAFEYAAHVSERGVLCLPETEHMVRVAFHLHISDADVSAAIDASRAVLGG